MRGNANDQALHVKISSGRQKEKTLLAKNKNIPHSGNA